MKWEKVGPWLRRGSEPNLTKPTETPAAPAVSLPPLTLAYVGDAVWELNIRTRLLNQGLLRSGALHQETVAAVKASRQSYIVRRLIPSLSEDELAVVRRARNTKLTIPKSSSVSEYRYATAFEALVGHLYLNGEYERLEELLELAWQFHVAYRN